MTDETRHKIETATMRVARAQSVLDRQLHYGNAVSTVQAREAFEAEWKDLMHVLDEAQS